ncbi:MAG: DUF3788 domain-containing protein [Lachnospiraceae bacterium]|nr:DUF3788 domain-containing protein [Lachnospiraceae bacterium]
MIDLLDKNYAPSLEEISIYVRNNVFREFCAEIKENYNCTEKIEYSACSMEKGWNIKFRKAGKGLCTIYPREGYFTVLVVIRQKEKEQVEEILPECSGELREIYAGTKEGNGQRWLMIDLEDKDRLYTEIMRLIEIRRAK